MKEELATQGQGIGCARVETGCVSARDRLYRGKGLAKLGQGISYVRVRYKLHKGKGLTVGKGSGCTRAGQLGKGKGKGDWERARARAARKGQGGLGEVNSS